ncbi:MAG: lysylphosphatidylglycerol synthase transmembrane domain-containing protein [Candidatus Micrarchaeaceae archaeon]
MPSKKHHFRGLNIPTKMVGRKEYVHLIHRLRLFAMLGLGASIAVFILVAIFGGFKGVISTIEHANTYFYSMAFVCVFLGFMARYGKWGYYMHRLGIKVDQTKSFLIYLSAGSMDITPGRVGRIIAAYTLKKVTNIKFMSIAPIVTMDLFTDFFGFAILAFFTALYVRKYLVYVLAFDLILIIPFILVINPWIFNYIKTKKKWHFLGRLARHGDNYYMSQNKLNKPSIYIGSLLFTVPADILNSMGLYFSLLAIGIKPKAVISLFIFATSQIFGMVSTLPGGIGVTDATLVALIKAMLGLSPAASSAVTIMTRMATLWFGVVLGFIVLAYTLSYWQTQKKRKKDKSKKLK